MCILTCADVATCALESLPASGPCEHVRLSSEGPVHHAATIASTMPWDSRSCIGLHLVDSRSALCALDPDSSRQLSACKGTGECGGCILLVVHISMVECLELAVPTLGILQVVEEGPESTNARFPGMPNIAI